MKRVLIITRGAWSNDNNTGNTINNLFDGSTDFEFHNLYLRSESTDATCPCKSIFRITEGQLINNILKGKVCGEYVNTRNNQYQDSKEDKAYRFAKRIKSYILWWLRELLWALGKWDNELFLKYILGVSPDIVFMPVYGCFYPHKILKRIHELTSAKVVLFHADDNYSLKQFNLSPIYWIYRFRLRHWVRKSVQISKSNYAISTIQKEEYQNCFNREFKTLQKFSDFSSKPVVSRALNSPIKLVFTGNISSGRWRTLSMMGQAIDEINKDKVIAHLDIYSATELTNSMRKALSCKSISFKGFVPSSQIPNIQSDADILVHIESFKFADKLEVRHSFSTKIVDYLALGKCILAVGPGDVASIRYLQDNDAAYVISDSNHIKEGLKNLLCTQGIIAEYAEKPWNVGRINHHFDKRLAFHKELEQL